MSISERLKKYIREEKGVSISSFEKEINVSNGYINSISKGIGEDILAKIADLSPNLNIEWLMIGRGEMLKGNTFIKGNKNSNIQQMNLGNADFGDNANIVMQSENPEKQEKIEQKYEDSNDDVISILKKQIEIQNIQLQEKNEQIKMLLDIIKK